jgi:hypothetical protein
MYKKSLHETPCRSQPSFMRNHTWNLRQSSFTGWIRDSCDRVDTPTPHPLPVRQTIRVILNASGIFTRGRDAPKPGKFPSRSSPRGKRILTNVLPGNNPGIGLQPVGHLITSNTSYLSFPELPMPIDCPPPLSDWTEVWYHQRKLTSLLSGASHVSLVHWYENHDKNIKKYNNSIVICTSAESPFEDVATGRLSQMHMFAPIKGLCEGWAWPRLRGLPSPLLGHKTSSPVTKLVATHVDHGKCPIDATFDISSH